MSRISKNHSDYNFWDHLYNSDSSISLNCKLLNYGLRTGLGFPVVHSHIILQDCSAADPAVHFGTDSSNLIFKFVPIV